MNANRMKYATTPTYGMQKRGLFRRPEPVYKAPESPDFAQTTERVDFSQPLTTPAQPGFQQPAVRPAANAYVQQPYFPPNLSIPPMQAHAPVGYPPQPPYGARGYADPASYAKPQGYMPPPLGNSAPPLNPVSGGFSARGQGYAPPAGQAAQGPAYMGAMQPQAPLMGGVPLTGAMQQPAPVYQPMAGYPQQPVPPFAPQQPAPPYRAPAAPPAQRPRMDVNKLWMSFLFILLPVLFIPCLFVPASLNFMRYAFLVLCVAGLGAMWYRQMLTQTTRLVVSVVYVGLCIVCIAMMMQGGRDARQNAAPVSAPSGQVTAAPQGQPQEASPGEVTQAPPEPTPSPSGPSEAEQRLTTFMNLWMGMSTPEMVSYVQPTWASAQENPSSQLFVLLANRTPESFAFEEISGSDEDNSRTVTMTATINKNNGKDPVIYRFMVVMVKEGGEWYVDPNSLATNDAVEPEDENVVNNSNASGLMTMAPRMTVTPVPAGETPLYYNADGGSFYHLDANCPSVFSQYLPLTASFPYSDLAAVKKEKGLQPCVRCHAPTQVLDAGD